MAKLFESDQQPVRIGLVACDADDGSLAVAELKSLVQDIRAVDYGSGDEKELLITVGCEQFEALMQEERADRVVPAGVLLNLRHRLLDSLQVIQDLIGLPEL